MNELTGKVASDKTALASEPYSRARISEPRLLLTCSRCGWVHYVMTAEEMRTTQGLAQRYQMTSFERGLLLSAYRQCMRCESPASDFRLASESDLAPADGHLVTPVYVESLPGRERDERTAVDFPQVTPG